MENYKLFDLFNPVCAIVVERNGNVLVAPGIKFREYGSYVSIVMRLLTVPASFFGWRTSPQISAVILIHRFKLIRFNYYDLMRVQGAEWEDCEND